MWRLTKPTSHGGISVRSVFTVVITALVAVFLVTLSTTLLNSTSVHAETAPTDANVSTATATWSEGAISYNDQTYQGPLGDTVVKQLGLPDKTVVYSYVDPDTTTDTAQSGTSNSSNSPPAVRQIHIVYFAASADPSKATQAQYKTYTYQNSTTFTDPSSVKNISIDPSGYTTNDTSSTCAVPGGLGWIICPLSNTLAGAMDWIFQQLKAFFIVQPATVGDHTNSLYIAWSIARSIGNVVFIIVFLVIIYSQISNVGITNYGLKKLLPRLIVAAILVNISYYICAIAIDLSNVLGASIEGIFTSMRDNLFNTPGGVNNTGQDWTWQLVTAGVLGGGTAFGAFAVSAGGASVGLMYMLVPLLVGLSLTALVVLLILAARQAIIVILLIISPLAFVAYLLPNTEKLFGRWRELFITMLVFFPAFSLVFGGAQLASAVIIQNASSITMIILGLAVQVAPLVITPLLLRLSGNLLGRIAGIVNDPKKGILDRSRNWANRRVENQRYKKYQGLRDNLSGKNGRFRQGLSYLDAAGRTGRWLDYRKHSLEKSTERGKAQFEAYTSKQDVTTQKGQRIELETGAAKHEAENYQNRMKLAVENLKTGDEAKGRDELFALRREADVTIIERARGGITGKDVGDIRIGNISYKNLAAGALHHAKLADIDSKAIASATAIATGIQQQNYAEAVQATGEKQVTVEVGGQDINLAVRAGGIHIRGDVRALASAQNVIEEETDKMIKMIEVTTPIKAGEIGKLQAALNEAVLNKDVAAAVAYTNKLAASNSAGIQGLRTTLLDLDTSANDETLTSVKQYINVNSNTNSGAEDIASWSRHPEKARLSTVMSNPKMWLDLTPSAWSSQKLDTQIAAIKNGGLNLELAKQLQDPNNFNNIKGPMRRVVNWVVENEGRLPDTATLTQVLGEIKPEDVD